MSKGSKDDSKYSSNNRINNVLNKVMTELRAFTEEQARHINELAAIGRAMSAESDTNVILEMILTKARDFTHADGGTLYLVNEDRDKLDFHVLHNDTLDSFQGGTSGNPITIPSVPLYTEDGEHNHQNVSAHVAQTGEVINIPDVYEAEGFNFEGTKKFDEALKYRSMSMLVVPLTDHENEIIGVLQLINAEDPASGETVPFSNELVDITTALASQAAVMLTQQKLINDMKALFDSFVKAIATAIDEKSKYTGGHIARVTELTMMIAYELDRVEYGPYADIHFTDKELEALRLAAWLHDTGKITTPEYVVDKAKKLETVYDRVDLVKSRWHTLKLARELEAEREKQKYISGNGNANPEKVKEIEEKLTADLEALKEEYEYVDRINFGGEFMADEKIQRLHDIADHHSYEIEGEIIPFLNENEIYNLSIRKGTLTNEEREIMNNHALMSIKILEQLPWPKHLKEVPAIAGAHHEKLDGTGYPFGLKAEEISLESRIMAVADIFEALSAKDRPYKKPMPLSQAIKILGFMVKDNHIDADVVELFISSGLVFDYAEKYLDETQMDIERESFLAERAESKKEKAEAG